MSNIKHKKIITFIFIILWMILVFCFSNQVSDESSKLSGSLTKLILEKIGLLEVRTIQEQEVIETVIRKLAHYLIYTLGGILILLHINLYKITEKRKKILSWIIGTVYAMTDEFHQLFIPGRSGEVRDVCIDSLGVITGICILMLILKFIKKCKNEVDNNG